MVINNFFTVESKLLSSSFQAAPVGLPHEDENRLYGEHKLIQGDYSDITFPVIFKYSSGNKLNDVIDTGWAGLYLISNKMLTILEENNVSGFKAYPSLIIDKLGNPIKGYHGFSVTGRCGAIDYERPEII